MPGERRGHDVTDAAVRKAGELEAGRGTRRVPALRRQGSRPGRAASAVLGIFRSVTSRATSESLRLRLRA